MCFSCSVIEAQCTRVCVCVSDRQDVCRAECSGSIKNEPNKFKTRNKVNNLKISAHDKIVVKMFVCLRCDVRCLKQCK